MYGNVLRISPPMNIGRADVDQFLKLLDRSLAACRAMAGGAR
jgi:4-aminobutyrate aminotransferase-like enzyme